MKLYYAPGACSLAPHIALAEAGIAAEVIRVDQIGGGPDFRRWPVTAENNSLYWENLNRAKKSVALDLSRPEGRELLQQLVRATGQFIVDLRTANRSGIWSRIWRRLTSSRAELPPITQTNAREFASN